MNFAARTEIGHRVRNVAEAKLGGVSAYFGEVEVQVSSGHQIWVPTFWDENGCSRLPGFDLVPLISVRYATLEGLVTFDNPEAFPPTDTLIKLRYEAGKLVDVGISA